MMLSALCSFRSTVSSTSPVESGWPIRRDTYINVERLVLRLRAFQKRSFSETCGKTYELMKIRIGIRDAV